MKNEFTKLLLILSLLLMGTSIFATVAESDTIWTYQDTSQGRFLGLGNDSDNNIILGSSAGGGISILKLDTDKNVIWNHSFSEYSDFCNLLVDASDNIWVLTVSEVSLIKIDSEGEVLASMNCIASDVRSTSMTMSEDGSAFITSMGVGNPNYPKWVLSKINSNCEAVWSKVFEGSYYFPREITLDNEGNIIVAGYTGANSTDGCVILKFDSEGNKLWEKIPIEQYGSVQGVTCDSENNIFVTGTNASGFNRYVIKLAPNGGKVWSFSSEDMCTSYGVAIAQDLATQEDVILTVGDKNQGSFEGDLRLSATSSTGTELWTSILSVSEFEYYSRILIDKNKNVICSGGVHNGSEIYGFVAKYQPITGSSINENTVASTVLYQNYPNPFNPVTTISFVADNAEKVKLSVYNMKGELVKNLLNKYVSAGEHSIKFDASNLNTGVYYYLLETSKMKITKKMVFIK